MLPSRRVVIAAAAITLLAAGAAMAQSSLGIGAAEPAITPTGPLAGTLQWINTQQQAFYRTLTGALKAMREDGSRLWVLIGLSFAYGVFHAAGPGHGKAVISSYMLANEVALRRGRHPFLRFRSSAGADRHRPYEYRVPCAAWHLDLHDRRRLVSGNRQLRPDRRFRRLAPVAQNLGPYPHQRPRTATHAQPFGSACP